MNIFSDIFSFDWYQICKNLNFRITENMAQNCTANFNAKWAPVSCVTLKQVTIEVWEHHKFIYTLLYRIQELCPVTQVAV